MRSTLKKQTREYMKNGDTRPRSPAGVMERGPTSEWAGAAACVNSGAARGGGGPSARSAVRYLSLEGRRREQQS